MMLSVKGKGSSRSWKRSAIRVGTLTAKPEATRDTVMSPAALMIAQQRRTWLCCGGTCLLRQGKEWSRQVDGAAGSQRDLW